MLFVANVFDRFSAKGGSEQYIYGRFQQIASIHLSIESRLHLITFWGRKLRLNSLSSTHLSHPRAI